MNIWVNDPGNNNQPSVSLTLLVVFALGALTAASLQMAGVVQSTSIFPELFYSATALYFGRRLNISGKAFSSDKAEEIEKKLEDK